VSTPPLEIERVFLLDGLPPLPAASKAFRIEQGYLPDAGAGDETLVEGRVRRTVKPDGSEVRTHTIKRGQGLVREEIERELDEQEFAELWTRTEGRRISKTRHKVPVGDLTWEIDAFDTFELVFAEVELPSVETESPFPGWLEKHVVRDLTEDPRYRNYCLATVGLPEGHAV
jgi:adenylate cyclase